MKHRWYGDHSVQTAIWAIGRDREIKYQIKKEDDEIIGMRRRRFWGSDAVRLELHGVGADQRPIGVMVSTNRIDWKLLPPTLLPPNLRNTGQSGYAKSEMSDYKTTWEALLNPVACENVGIDFYALWWGKDLVWDFDNPKDMKAAFDAAHKVAQYLEEEHKVRPVIIFSGSKGFHVWVKAEEAAKVVGWDMKVDGPNFEDPLREQGRGLFLLRQRNCQNFGFAFATGRFGTQLSPRDGKMSLFSSRKDRSIGLSFRFQTNQDIGKYENFGKCGTHCVPDSSMGHRIIHRKWGKVLDASVQRSAFPESLEITLRSSSYCQPSIQDQWHRPQDTVQYFFS